MIFISGRNLLRSCTSLAAKFRHWQLNCSIAKQWLKITTVTLFMLRQCFAIVFTDIWRISDRIRVNNLIVIKDL
jgi:hypothetical protein